MAGRRTGLRRAARRWRARRAEVAAARANRADGTRCFYCDVAFVPGGRRQRTVDHRVARSRGGADGLANMVFACLACNQRKADAPAVEFESSAWLRRRRAAISAEQGPPHRR